MTDVPTLAFQSSLTLEAILFAAFGIFFSVYALFFSLVDPDIPEKRQVRPIVHPLRQVCRGITLLIVLNAVIAIYSLVRIAISNFKPDSSGFEIVLLSIGLAVTIVGIAIISSLWAFRYMPR